MATGPDGERTELLAGLIAPAVADAPRRAAVIDDTTSVNFAELEQYSLALAGAVAARTDPGDRVAVVADNGVPYALLYYAVPRCRRILTLINQRLNPDEQARAIAAAGARVLIGDPRYLDALPADVAETVIVIDGPDWQRALRHPSYDGPAPTPEDPAWLVFTSGTTGHPKAAVHTHRSLTAGAWGTVEGRSVEPADVYLTPYPLCHIAGYNILARHATGSTVVLPSRYRADEFVATVNRYGVRSCSMAPTMLHALVAHVTATGETMPTLRQIAYGSAPISADLIERATRILGAEFHQGYGMTETAGTVTFLGPEEHRMGAEVLRSAGRPHRGVEVGIADDGPGGFAAVGQIGEILVRGPQVMTGYWRDEAATAAALTDGWLHTGDIGRLDDGGRLTIVDRSKDVIITGGENVSSREVEDALSRHPDVDMVAVVGVPDDYWGEAICAVVVTHPGSAPTADELIDYVRHQISPFKRPRHVVFAGALPLTHNAKIAKDRVREIARAAVAAAGETHARQR